jgi:hypothetical protein
MERREISTTAAGFDFAIEFRQLLAQSVGSMTDDDRCGLALDLRRAHLAQARPQLVRHAPKSCGKPHSREVLHWLPQSGLKSDLLRPKTLRRRNHDIAYPLMRRLIVKPPGPDHYSFRCWRRQWQRANHQGTIPRQFFSDAPT